MAAAVMGVLMITMIAVPGVAATPTTTTLTLAKPTILSNSWQTYTVTIHPAPDRGLIQLRYWDEDQGRWRGWYEWDVEPGESVQRYQALRIGDSTRKLKAVFDGTSELARSESDTVTETVKLRPASLSITIAPSIELAEGSEVRLDWSQRIDDTSIRFHITPAGDPGAWVANMFPLDVPTGTTAGTTTLPRIPPGDYILRADMSGTANHESVRAKAAFTVSGIPAKLTLTLDHRYTADGVNRAVITVTGTDLGGLLDVAVFKDDEPSTVYASDWPFPLGGVAELPIDVGTGDAGPFHIVVKTHEYSLYAPSRVDDWFWVGSAPDGDVAIDAGAPETDTPDVLVDVPAVDEQGVAQVRIANQGSVDDAGRLLAGRSQPYDDQVDWELKGKDCTCVVDRTVWVQWRDAYGTWSQAKTDSIGLRSIPWPGVPAVAIREAPMTFSTTVPLVVAWKDGHSGRTYDATLDAADSTTWVARDSSDRRATTSAVVGTAMRGRVQAHDAQGHASSWVEGRPFTPAVVRASADAVKRTGRWTVNGDTLASTAAGARLTLTAKLQGVGIVARRGPGLGRIKVIIDGRTVETIDLSAAKQEPTSVLFAKAWSTIAKHTVSVVQVSGRVALVSFAELK